MKRPTTEHPVSQLLDSLAASDGSTLPTDAELRRVAMDETGGHPNDAARLQRELRAAALDIARHAGMGHAGPARAAAREAAAQLAVESWNGTRSDEEPDIAAIVADCPRL